VNATSPRQKPARAKPAPARNFRNKPASQIYRFHHGFL
jgi:hypothetical protein